jgi:hypothetical protein
MKGAECKVRRTFCPLFMESLIKIKLGWGRGHILHIIKVLICSIMKFSMSSVMHLKYLQGTKSLRSIYFSPKD